MEASGYDPRREEERTERMLPPEMGDLTDQGIKTAEQLLAIEERKRRARFTFWVMVLVVSLLALPLAALIVGLCIRIATTVAG